jgi:predicted nucleic acid-binding protein
MKAVVDTNVVAYFLLGTEEFVEEARGFWRSVKEPIAPALWEAELANVVWMAVRAKVLAPEEAPKRLTLAAALGIESVSTRSLWHGALARAVSSGVAVYDTLFVELASREHLLLATFDDKILRSFPDLARRPGALTG